MKRWNAFSRPRSTAQSFFLLWVCERFHNAFWWSSLEHCFFFLFSSRLSLLCIITQLFVQSSFLIYSRVRRERFQSEWRRQRKKKYRTELFGHFSLWRFLSHFPLFFFSFNIWQKLIAGTSGPVNPKLGANNKHTGTQQTKKFLCGCNKREKKRARRVSLIDDPFTHCYSFSLYSSSYYYYSTSTHSGVVCSNRINIWNHF
jgi:hypothetical protein